MPAPTEPRPDKSNFALVAIGVFKLVKGGLLIALGITLVHWRHQDLGAISSRWVDTLFMGRPYFDSIVSRLSSINERTLKEAAAGSFVYSAVFLVEGVGLCRGKRWAEFLTVGITGSLLPFEFYTLARRFTPTGVLITLLNVAILWYLIVQLMKLRRRFSPSSSEMD